MKEKCIDHGYREAIWGSLSYLQDGSGSEIRGSALPLQLFVKETEETLFLAFTDFPWLVGSHVLDDLLDGTAGIVVSAQHVNELAFRVHEVEENGVVDKIVLAWFEVPGRTKVNSVVSAAFFHFIIVASQANDTRMKFT